jgi:hypothetical protein
MTYGSSSSSYGNTFFGTFSSNQACCWFFSVIPFAVAYLFAFVAVSVARRGSEGEWGATGGLWWRLLGARFAGSGLCQGRLRVFMHCR